MSDHAVLSADAYNRWKPAVRKVPIQDILLSLYDQRFTSHGFIAGEQRQLIAACR
jgi:hypothetical protein